jgi:hypothetical protein
MDIVSTVLSIASSSRLLYRYDPVIVIIVGNVVRNSTSKFSKISSVTGQTADWLAYSNITAHHHTGMLHH